MTTTKNGKKVSTKTKSVSRLPKVRPMSTEDMPLIHMHDMTIKEMSFTVNGLAPLCVHRWGAKAISQLEAGQGIKAKKVREPKDAVSCFLDTLMRPNRDDKIIAIDEDDSEITRYAPDDLIEGLQPVWATFEDGTFDRFVFPAHAFREAMGSASMASGVTRDKVSIRRLIGVSKIMLPIETPEPPQMRFDIVSVQGKADLRFRAQFNEWSMRVTVRFATCIANEQTIINLANMSGFLAGVGEMRPEKKVGTFGHYTVDTESVEVAII